MSTQETEEQFLLELMAEKRQSQDRRGRLISLKLGWITGLFSLGAIKLPFQIETQTLLYLVPIIAIVFDLYVLGENYGIKRMGAFVRINISPSINVDWESWLGPRRDKFSWYALPLSSYVVLIACAVLLFDPKNITTAWCIWIGGLSILMFVIFYSSAKSLQRLDELPRKTNVSP